MIRRLYHPDSIPKLIAFGRKQHERLGFELPFSPERCEMLLRAAMVPHSPDKAVWGAYDGNKVCGVLIAGIEPFAFMTGDYVFDYIFVADKHGERLFRAMLQWGTSHGAQAVQVAITSSAGTAEKFYEAQGMKRIGGNYFKPLEASA